MSPIKTHALISHKPLPETPLKPNFQFSELSLRDIQPNEILVKMVATGVCHTDLNCAVLPVPNADSWPKVLGHEGAGIVQSIGSQVSKTKPGDRVLLSFTSCQTCHTCRSSHPSYCTKFLPLNVSGDFTIYSSLSNEKEDKVLGSFFGQSSFATISIVKEECVVVVNELLKDEEELKIFSPLGCGVQTGAGAIVNIARPKRGESVCVVGLGGVGMSAIMAAKILGCNPIIGIDLISSRLPLAAELGATHTIHNTLSPQDLIAEVQKITGGMGANVVIDTTGNMGVLETCIEFTAIMGQCVMIGQTGRDAVCKVPVAAFMVMGKSLKGCMEGDSVPAEFIPQMIKWYREGKFPVDKMIKTYPAKDFQKAMDDMHSGETVKPVLVWD